MQPGSLAYLPLFVPWTAFTDIYQLRAVAQALLVPELLRPGAVGRALGTWIVGLARAVANLELKLTVTGSGSSWVALAVTFLVAGLAWVRVFSEGYDFNLTTLMNLLGLLARVALLPLALLVLMLLGPSVAGPPARNVTGTREEARTRGGPLSQHLRSALVWPRLQNLNKPGARIHSQFIRRVYN